ncbi:MAG: hypothetical protein V9E98_05705 [Candidatus Nanopelagicales bacterium]
MRSGSRWHRLTQIFSNPKLPEIEEYYEPWTYDYDTLITAPLGDQTPGRAAEVTYQRRAR